MSKSLILALSLLTTTLSVSSALASSGSHWGYEGKMGPANWAQLTPENGACAGKNQSPINLTGFIESDLKAIDFSYRAGGNEILNNGHTVQVNYAKGSSMKIDNIQFNLLQFHFHAPSENHIMGKSYPLEAHFVHADKEGNLAVVALMFEEGKENSALAGAWSQMPAHAGDKSVMKTTADANKILPASKDYYRFNGSLTTPPCSEGVRWFVMKEAVSASKEQIHAFEKVMHHGNNRPIQATNARPLLK
ncbi:carbonic anhydrase [sulfur-oxidizing endosymbiont of Gigantopelta aegis]|uniref:carbonic anhydrase n=1 Tax=sulfur-oxidizing endosymbiont of Gigantopelta aegis TaxID=2794934 RepID=UPI0018DC5B1A|nr:carbonic anhydrase family protein [sulfur-oxidizing endosymbiont of Gigantopelta aegis]